jgi:hypothetical protein
MDEPLQAYKQFVDGLVQQRPSIEARRAREGVWHRDPPPDQVKFNELLRSLSPEQRETLAEMLQKTRDGGIHDTLVYLTDEFHGSGLRLSYPGIELPVEPFGTEMYYDWVARMAGDEWPEPG